MRIFLYFIFIILIFSGYSNSSARDDNAILKMELKKGVHADDLLVRAISFNDENAVEFLVSHISNINKFINGYTPLGFAASRNRVEIVRILLRNGADPNLGRSSDHETPLMLASFDPQFKVSQILLEAGAFVNKCDKGGWTALCKAASFGQTNTVRLLLANDADVDLPTTDGFTPLMAAACNSYTDTFRVLIEHAFAVDAVDSRGNTALIYAATSGDLEIVELLLERNADISVVNRQGISAITAALMNNHREVVRALRNIGAAMGPAVSGDNLAYKCTK